MHPASYPGAFTLNPVLNVQISDEDNERARVLGEDGEGTLARWLSLSVYITLD